VDFCNLLAEATRGGPHERIADLCKIVSDAVGQVVGRTKGEKAAPGRQGTVGVDVQYAGGLSIYFPWRLTYVPPEYAAKRRSQSPFPELAPYSALRLSEKTGWDKVLATYLERTMRPAKSLDGGRVAAQLAGVAIVADAMGGKIDNSHKFVEGINRFVEGINRFVEGINRFALANSTQGNMKNWAQEVAIDLSKVPKLAPTKVDQPV
jgi:hypothetical protein